MQSPVTVTAPRLCFEAVTLNKKAKANLDSIRAIKNAEILVFGPSNPIVSIAPIIGINGIRKCVQDSKSIKVAVSPLIAGKAVKGPAKEMLESVGFRGNVIGVAEYYKNLIDILIIDKSDENYTKEIENFGIKVLSLDILLKDKAKKIKLAEKIIELV